MQNANRQFSDFERLAFGIVHLPLRMTRFRDTARSVVARGGALSTRLFGRPAHPELIAADDGLCDR